MALDLYQHMHTGIVTLVDQARCQSARSVNALMTATYWEIGRRLVTQEQAGVERAAYGQELIRQLSGDLSRRFGRGFSQQNLWQMRAFYLAWPCSEILQTLSGELPQIQEINMSIVDLAIIGKRFPLPWSAYVRLLSVKNLAAREFYETEALRCGWSVRQLERQVGSQITNARRCRVTSWPCWPRPIACPRKLRCQRRMPSRIRSCWSFSI